MWGRLVLIFLGFAILSCVDAGRADGGVHRNAYATMMYMGTPRDYEFYVATRVLLRSLAKFEVDADLVVIASMDVPTPWVRALEEEDGAKVVRVENIKNPYSDQSDFDRRFKLTLNKLYAWKLVNYERVVMLDADNLFLRNTDELFRCGQFCAVFINPCIFHTGLFVLQPSLAVFDDMMHELEIGRSNPDGADQGFITGYFPNLLDSPQFHAPPNGTKLDGFYRLPLGYQMDASYYYLKLRWNVPCGPNSVVTFPGASWLKPWYWWSWPVLPLGIDWHKRRLETLGYASEMPIVLIQAVFYLGIMAVANLARPNLSKLCYRREEKSAFVFVFGFKFFAFFCIVAAYLVPVFLIPCTIHPVIGWSLYFVGALSLCFVARNAFLLPMLPVMVPWFGFLGALVVMAYPWYSNGVVRALFVFGYAFCSSPFLYVMYLRIVSSLQVSREREGFLPRLGESVSPQGFSKLY